MATDNLRTILVGTLILCLFVVGFGIFIADVGLSYGRPADLSNITSLNKFDSLKTNADDLYTSVQRASNPRSGLTGFIDIIGGIGGSLWEGSKLTARSADTMKDMTVEGMRQLPLGAIGAMAVSIFIAIIMVTIGFLLIKMIMKV